MRPQTTGASRWSGWKLKTSSCHTRCRGPWLLRQRRLVKPEQRSGFQDMFTAQQQHQKCVQARTSLCFLFAGYRCRGRDERLPRPQRGVAGHRRVAVGPAAALPADPQHHRGWEELHHRLPAAHGAHVSLYAEITAQQFHCVCKYVLKCARITQQLGGARLSEGLMPLECNLFSLKCKAIVFWCSFYALFNIHTYVYI